MAYFAQVDTNNTVVNVIVVHDSVLVDSDGTEFCSGFGDGRWIQTEVEGNARKIFAGIGDTYRDDVDAFQPAPEYASWTFNDDIWDWEPPTPMPASIGPWAWNEETTSWEAVE